MVTCKIMRSIIKNITKWGLILPGSEKYIYVFICWHPVYRHTASAGGGYAHNVNKSSTDAYEESTLFQNVKIFPLSNIICLPYSKYNMGKKDLCVPIKIKMSNFK